MKKALITGLTGQDGIALSKLLLSKGYEVHGLVRRPSQGYKSIPDHKIITHIGDLCDHHSLSSIINRIQPDEIYNLGAMSHVRHSFDIPTYALDTVAMGTARLLEAARPIKGIKFYQASSSEMFGNSPAPQSETTLFNPRSPYAVAKVAAHNLANNYREAYGMFVCCGILFNHEGPNRSDDFVTRKITKAVANILFGLQSELVLGNLDAKRDFGLSDDYVEAMYMMMQHEKPDDYVVATGETHSVKEFLEVAFSYAGLNWQDYVRYDSKFARPTEVNVLCGDATKITKILGWKPKTSFVDLVKLMVDNDIAIVRPYTR